jgi:hypothetical protein
MPLTREFKETAQALLRADRKYRKAAVSQIRWSITRIYPPMLDLAVQLRIFRSGRSAAW